MLRLSSAVLIAAMTTGSASAEGLYLGTGFASVNAEEPGYKYGSTNILGLIGYEVNDYLSLEGELSVAISKDTIRIASTNIEIGTEHMAAYAKLTLPTAVPIKPYARFGMARAKASATVGSTTVSVNDSAFSYGIGAEWELSEQTGIRLDYTAADYGVTDASVLALTSVFRF